MHKYAVKNGKEVPQYWTNHEEASYCWFTGFMQRNSKFSIRRTESTSFSWAIAFNRRSVTQYFDKLREVLKPELLYPKKV